MSEDRLRLRVEFHPETRAVTAMEVNGADWHFARLDGPESGMQEGIIRRLLWALRQLGNPLEPDRRTIPDAPAPSASRRDDG